MKTNEKLNVLEQHASKRKDSFPVLKTQKDVSIENGYFDDLKEETYAGIARDPETSGKL